MPRKGLYNRRNIKDIIEKRFNILVGLVIVMLSSLVMGLVTIQIVNQDTYKERLKQATEKIIYSKSVPRGRIYDRNYNLLVDNVGKKTIFYVKPSGIKQKNEIDLAYKIAAILSLPYDKLHKTNLKEFWIANNKDKADKKITEEEYKQYDERKLTLADIQKLKLERITDEDLSIYNELDKEAAYIFYLMNKGYAYEEKIIKDRDVTDEEYAIISENRDLYKGFNTKLDWERKYLYGDVLRGILGNISDNKQGLPLELKDAYLEKGYALDDRVGLSNLEYQYEELLKGNKSMYKVNADKSTELLKEGSRGKDIVLSIDINLQMEIEKIMEEEMILAKKQPNTEYYNKSFVIISNPHTGEILAYAAKQIISKNGQYEFYDYSPHLSTTTITAGSVVKGASMTVGYNTGAITIGTKMLDECIKIKNTPTKCSWTKGIGVVDDVGALRMSSNSYQFKIAMKVGKANYKYNAPLAIDEGAFDTYRNTFKEYGLGVKTGIDLPNEGTGYKGDSQVAGHLLDYAIGQYDTYTPLQIVQYINTIANGGSRIQLHFLKEIHAETMSDKIGNLESTYEPFTYNKVNIDNKYLDRIRYSLTEVIKTGTGIGYMGNVPNPAGKTGTSQSFIDTNNDGSVDTQTITNLFAGYYPSNNPVMSIVVISPDASHIYGSSYRTMVNKRISSKITQKFFDIYK